MKKYIILILLSLPLQLLIAQEESNKSRAKIEGKILNNLQEPVEFASITLHDSNDELIQGVISNAKGKFRLENIPLGVYNLHIQFLGFEKWSQKLSIDSESQRINLKTISLEDDKQSLDEVTIRSERTEYSLKLDKKIFNVGQDLISQSNSALDILDQVPLVSVDPGGSISLRGDSQVQILINGKRSAMTMNNAIEQIAAENIDRVEVITNPSAKYDANGSAGIINIILKKNINSGLNGQIRAIAGIPANHIIMPSLNYKNNAINVFSNFRWRYSDYNGRYNTLQSANSQQESYSLSKNERENRHDDGLSGYVGMDIALNEKNNITLAYFRTIIRDIDETNLYYNLQESGFEDFEFNRLGNSEENRNYNQLEANYTKEFNKKGTELTFDLQYDFWNSDKFWLLKTFEGNTNSLLIDNTRTNNYSGTRDFVAQLAFNTSIKEGEFEMGTKFENRTVENDYLAENQVEQAWTVFRNIDNEIVYSEVISAAYAEYSNSWKKISYKIGLRAENTAVEVSDDEEVFSNSNNYLKLFPSVFGSYKLNQANTVQMSYSRRINRPSLWDLYPFSEITDVNIQRNGNPNLIPSFSDALELSFLHVHEKVTLNSSIYGKLSSNPFSATLIPQDSSLFIIMPINLDKSQEAGADLSIRYRPAKFASVNMEFSYFYFKEEGSYNGNPLSAEGLSWSGRLRANFDLPKEYNLYSSFQYRGPRSTPQINYLASYDLSAGINRDLLNDKLNLGFRASNILDSRIQRSVSSSPDFTLDQRSRRTGTRYTVSILYKINQKPRDRAREPNRQNR